MSPRRLRVGACGSVQEARSRRPPACNGSGVAARSGRGLLGLGGHPSQQADLYRSRSAHEATQESVL